jgi:hypothetical protein
MEYRQYPPNEINDGQLVVFYLFFINIKNIKCLGVFPMTSK